jgi:hypothetical protein
MKSIKYITCLSLLVVAQAVSQTTPERAPYLKEAAISETEGTVHVAANSPRPLAQTLDALHRKYGWVVDYEDPRFGSKLDVVEVVDKRIPAANSILLPAGGPFSVEFPATSPDEEKTLRSVVESYNQSNNPGRFELRKGAQGAFYVIGTAAHDAKSQISPQQAVFDSPVTLVSRQRTASDTLNLICRRIAAQRGITVTLGVTPRNLLDHTPVKVGGTKVPARELLLQTLTATHGDCYWRLLFDPNSKGYFLDIHLIHPPKNPQ